MRLSSKGPLLALTCDTRGHREQARLADLGFRSLRGVKLRTKPRP